MMLKKATVIGLTGLALGAAPAVAGSIGNAETVALTMVGGGGLMSIGCMAIALATQDDEDDQAGYDRRGIYVALSGSYARENFSDSAVVNLVDGELREGLQGFRGTPVGDPDAFPNPIPPGDPGLYTFSFGDIDSDTFGISGRGGYRCHPYVSAELQFERLADFEGSISENDDITNQGIDPADIDTPRRFDLELESLVFTTNVKGYLLTGRYQPFILVGMGFMRMESKARDDGTLGTKPGLAPQASERTVDFALRFGGGIDFYLTRNVVVSAEASYLMPTGKLDNLDYYSLGLGLQYRF
ncbi:MAG: outer membrane beta-barrel protein [Myxococcota bacterium]